MNLDKLHWPFPMGRVHWRVGATNGDKTSGLGLAYIDARDVMQRLDSVCGAANWQDDYPWSDGKKVVCRIGIKIDGEWVWKSNGAGATDVEGEKGAFSDAFKRAAVLWGIGQYLYETPNKFVPIEPYGRSYKFPASSIELLNRTLSEHLKPYKKMKFDECYAAHKSNVDSMLDAIIEEDLKSAADCWFSIPEDDQMFLLLSMADGGIFDQKIKTIIRSTEFRQAYIGEAA